MLRKLIDTNGTTKDERTRKKEREDCRQEETKGIETNEKKHYKRNIKAKEQPIKSQ